MPVSILRVLLIHSIDKRLNIRFDLPYNAFGNNAAISEFRECVHDGNHIIPQR